MFSYECSKLFQSSYFAEFVWTITSVMCLSFSYKQIVFYLLLTPSTTIVLPYRNQSIDL